MAKTFLISDTWAKAETMKKKAWDNKVILTETILLDTDIAASKILQLSSRLKGCDGTRIVFDPDVIIPKDIIQAWMHAGGSRRLSMDNAKYLGWL